MNFYERVYNITKDDNQAIEAAKAFQEIFRLQKTWRYRMVSPGGMLPGLLMPLLPKFVLDNKEEFEIPEDLASGIDDLMRGYGRKESGFIIAIMNQFISYLDHWMGLQNRLIASIYMQQEGDNFFSFLNQCLKPRVRCLCFDQKMPCVGRFYGILEIFAVDGMDTAVDDRFLHRLQALFATHYQFAQGQHKVSFQSQRIVLLTVIAVNVQRVDILSAGGADVNDLPM